MFVCFIVWNVILSINLNKFVLVVNKNVKK